MMSPGGELVDNNLFQVKQEGKSVWLIYRDSNGRDYSENGVHKIKYESYRFFKRYKMVLTNYNLDNKEIDTINNSYSKIFQIVKNGQIIKVFYKNKYGNLVRPNYLFYAKYKTKKLKGNKFRVRYFDEENNPVCNYRAFEIIYQVDTLWNKEDGTYLIQNKELRKKGCNGEVIK